MRFNVGCARRICIHLPDVNIFSVQTARVCALISPLPASRTPKIGRASETGMQNGFKVAAGRRHTVMPASESKLSLCCADDGAWARSTFGSDRSNVIGILRTERSIEMQIRRYGGYLSHPKRNTLDSSLRIIQGGPITLHFCVVLFIHVMQKTKLCFSRNKCVLQ